MEPEALRQRGDVGAPGCALNGPAETGEARGRYYLVLDLGQPRHYQRICPQWTERPGKRAGDRRSLGPQAKYLSSLNMLTGMPSDSPLWVML